MLWHAPKSSSFPKPWSIPRQLLQESDKSVTYISSFRCDGGLIMCADTQETRGEYKNYVEKIEIVENQSYPLAVGGAGVDDILKPFMQEIIERVIKSKPSTKAELQNEIRATIKTVYESDVPVMVLKKKQHLTPQFLIAAKPTNDDFCIFPVIGKRLYKELRRGIIGYPSSYNHGLLERLHRDNLPMLQAVVLAVYLVSQSKKFDEGVGGDTGVVAVTTRGAFRENPEYISYVEQRAQEFLKDTDSIFLACMDTTLGSRRLRGRLDKFAEEATSRYRQHIDSTMESLTFKEVMQLIPYQKHPFNTSIAYGSKGFKAEHDEAENKRVQKSFRENVKWAEKMKKRLRINKKKKI